MPRIKTYSATSGFVYQYCFASRASTPSGESYRFSTTEDRRPPFDVVVFLPEAAIGAWETEKGRAFTPTERYAVAKIALFAAFDAAEQPGRLPDPIEVDLSQVRHIAETLDL